MARGGVAEGSDIDVLVEPLRGTTCLTLAKLQLELEALLGVEVDIATPGAIGPRLVEQVMRDRRPSMKRSAETIRRISEWGGRTVRYIRGMNFEDSAHDEKTLDAVSRCIAILGEAAARLLEESSTLQEQHPDLELIAARAMRNRLSHASFGIDPQVLWDTAVLDVPRMVAAAERALTGRGRETLPHRWSV